mmetsp:Transcript_54007/g.167396  ORF Transcript_54007/g.167396 Transcript_54007/m.167396 type:complete len:224 (+) Transcript_54007:234-905(+)
MPRSRLWKAMSPTHSSLQLPRTRRSSCCGPTSTCPSPGTRTRCPCRFTSHPPIATWRSSCACGGNRPRCTHRAAAFPALPDVAGRGPSMRTRWTAGRRGVAWLRQCQTERSPRVCPRRRRGLVRHSMAADGSPALATRQEQGAPRRRAPAASATPGACPCTLPTATSTRATVSCLRGARSGTAWGPTYTRPVLTRPTSNTGASGERTGSMATVSSSTEMAVSM